MVRRRRSARLAVHRTGEKIVLTRPSLCREEARTSVRTLPTATRRKPP